MFLDDQEILNRTRRHMGLGAQEAVTMQPILKGGSDRRFLRMEWSKGSCIVMEYGLERAENALYAEIGRFLEAMGLGVPRILMEETEDRLLWVEDLGAEDLWSFRQSSWEERAPLYRSVLEEINKLHNDGLKRAEQADLKLMPGFDRELYAWERNYFYEKFAGVACGIALDSGRKEALEAVLSPMAEELMATPASLVHRDFQSQNILVRAGWTFLIDFQGMRTGSAYYDLASLIYDPYVPLAKEQRRELASYYYSLRGFRPRRELFDGHLRAAAIQRLMQALGAYGFLGIEKGKAAFLKHIDPAIRNLREVVEEHGLDGEVSRLLEQCEKAAVRVG